MLKPACRLVLLLLLAVSLLFCDVVELKNGQRLQGTFQQATSAGVVIEVGGQSITMPLEKVRAIFFGALPLPQATVPQTSDRALQALKTLQAITKISVQLPQFLIQIADATVQVDSLRNDAPGSAAIRLAMHYYELSASAWSTWQEAKLHPERGPERLKPLQEIGRLLEDDVEIGTCPNLSNMFVALRKDPINQDRSRRLGTAGIMVGQNPNILWPCASDKIAEAERLIGNNIK